MIKLLLAAVLLTGCGTTYKSNVVQETNTMPEDVRVRCDLIPESLQHSSHAGNVSNAYDELIGLYGECALRDAAKAKWIGSQGQ